MTVGVERLLGWVFGTEGDVGSETTVQVMVAAAAVLVLGVVLPSPLISDLSTVFGVSEARAGLLIVAISAPSIVLVPLLGMLADRIGRRSIFVPGLLVFGAAGAAIALTTNFRTVLALRVLQGIGFAAAMPLTITLFGDVYEGARESTAQSMRMAGINGMYIGTPTIAGIMFTGAWWSPFLLYLSAIPIGLWAWTVLPPTAPAGDDTFGEYLTDLVTFLRHPTIALYLTSFFLRFVILFGFITYISVLATQHVGLSVVVVGLLVTTKGAMSFVGSTQGGRLALQYSPAALVATGFLVGGAGIAAMGAVTTSPVLVGGTILFGIGDGILSPAQKSLVNELAPNEVRAGMMAFATSLQNIGKVVGPAVFASIFVVSGPPAAFVAVGIAGALLGAGVVVIGTWSRTASESLRSIA